MRRAWLKFLKLEKKPCQELFDNNELNSYSQIKKIISAQLHKPDDDFVRFFATRVYEGPITQKVREQFSELTLKALKQYLNDKINERLKSALAGDSERTTTVEQTVPEVDDDETDAKVFTTEEEIEGYNILRAILREVIEIERIFSRDTQSYFGVLLDNNNRKPLCRLHFNRTQKYIGLFDENKIETRHPIERIDDIFNFSAELKTTISFYE